MVVKNCISKQQTKIKVYFCQSLINVRITYRENVFLVSELAKNKNDGKERDVWDKVSSLPSRIVNFWRKNPPLFNVHQPF